MGRGHILLYDKPAEKQDTWIKRVSSTFALRGELLIAIPSDKIVGRSDGAKLHNYRLVKDETISLHAETLDVALLDDDEFLLLEAITFQLARYEAFVSDKVGWGKRLKLGDGVHVTISGKTPTSYVNVSAIVRYVGQTTNHSGLLFGVEIMDKAYNRYGTTDGTFQGTRYFTCNDGCGLFVALDRISAVRDHGSAHTEPSREGQSQRHFHQYGKSKKGVDDPGSRLRLGERVIVYNKKCHAIRGTVKWVGVHAVSGDLGFTVVGVETDIAVKKDDFEDAIPMKALKFKISAAHHGRVYLPEGFVVREKEGGEEPHSHEQPLNCEQLFRREQPRSHEQPLNREQPRNPASSFNVQDRDKLAKIYGYQSEAEMLHEQSEALRQALQGKEAKELEEIQKAEQFFDKQHEAFRDMEEKMKAVAAAELPHPSPETKTSGINNSPHIGSQAGSHPSSDYPSSAATQTGTAVQHPASSSGGHTSSVNDMANPPLVKGQSSYSELEQKVSDLQKANQQYQQENHQFQEEKHYFQEECYKLEQEVVQQRAAAAQAELQCHQEMENLQQRLDTALAEMQQLCPSPRTRVLVQDIDPWKVSRSEVQILSEMGRGAWGYVAKGRFRGQLVAVKSPHKILSEHMTERLQREVKIMTQVRHPNLLRIIAAVFDDHPQLTPLIVTELLDMNLREAYQKNRLSRASRIPIFRDVAYALHYLHEHQEPIIHRDVSAPNVLLEELPNGMFRAKVSDFGSANLAKLAQTLAEGAIIYAAPETFPPRDLHSPPPPQTTKIDVYSYGVLLCEVITCQLPDPQRFWSMLQEVKGQWTFMHDLIVSCTQHSPEDRLTMSQVLDKLNQLPRAQPRRNRS